MAETTKLLGLKELEYNLKLLGEELREKGVKRMMSRAAVPMRDDAKRRAPVLKTATPTRIPGTLRDAIKIWRQRKTSYAVTYYVGVVAFSKSAIRKFKGYEDRKGKQLRSIDNPKDPYYWRWVEFGTSKMRAQPFLRPAFEAQKDQSAQTALVEGRKFVEQTARRLKRSKK